MSKLQHVPVNSLEDVTRNFEQIEAAGMYVGSGAPTFAGRAGWYYFRTDTPAIANQRIYVCSGGTTWTGIL